MRHPGQHRRCSVLSILYIYTVYSETVLSTAAQRAAWLTLHTLQCDTRHIMYADDMYSTQHTVQIRLLFVGSPL